MESAAPQQGRAITLAVLAALGTGVVWALLLAVLNLHLGLLVVAAFGGWLIGSPLRATAAPRRGLLAVTIAAGAWLLGSMLEFVISQVLLPAATTPLLERLAVPRYFEYTAGTFGVVSVLSIAILLVVAWRSAR